jgi:alkanesulfonate monooxygenase SsuD/methylene tetrahydromethanopterin reductase-like flavin-dependent oxidoreductase (luciferase family)
MREEIEATGADFASRGRRADEAIDLMRALWADSGPDGATFEGEHFTVRRGHSYPKPTRPIPIHIGGHSAAAARRAGRRGDGLQPLGVDTAEVTRLWALTCEEAAACGRDPDQLELTLGGVLAAATAEREVSADRLVLSATGDLHDLAEACDEVSAAAQRLQL